MVVTLLLSALVLATNRLHRSVPRALSLGNRAVADRIALDETAAVTKTVWLPATPVDVWRALTTPEELSAWLGEVVELDARPGGPVILRESSGSFRRGIVEDAEPNRALVVRWRRLEAAGAAVHVGDATRVSFEIEAEGDSTRLTVREERVPFAMSRFDR
jgi:uncharacterized protein YndB with AHSA1/START domain